MPRRESLPKYVRRHGTGFRAVLAIDLGRRHYGPTYRTAEEAAAYAKAFLGTAAPADGVLDLAGARDLLLADLRHRGARPDTIDYYTHYLRRILERWGAGRMLHDIDAKAVQLYLAQREGKVKATTLYGHELGVLRRLFRCAIQAGRLHRDPTANIRPPKLRKGRFAALSQERVLEAVDRILASGKPQARFHADVVLLLFYTGLRLAEIGRLRVSDYRTDGNAATLFVDGKTGNRYQPVPKVLRPTIERLIGNREPDAPLVAASGKRRLASRVLEMWRQRLGWPDFSAHVLRHSYATAMVRLGVSPFDLQVLMGHASITQTQRYYHAAGPDLQRAADALGARQPAQRGTRRPSSGRHRHESS